MPPAHASAHWSLWCGGAPCFTGTMERLRSRSDLFRPLYLGISAGVADMLLWGFNNTLLLLLIVIYLIAGNLFFSFKVILCPFCQPYTDKS